MNNELYHHGIQGQKWGHRRWQNEDGTYNEAGKERYFGSRGGAPTSRSVKRKVKKDYTEALKTMRKEASKESAKEYKKAEEYAEKHGLDVDDVLYPDERDEYLKSYKEYGVDKKTAEAILEYSKKLDTAEVKENEIYKKYEKKPSSLFMTSMAKKTYRHLLV